MLKRRSTFAIRAVGGRDSARAGPPGPPLNNGEMENTGMKRITNVSTCALIAFAGMIAHAQLLGTDGISAATIGPGLWVSTASNEDVGPSIPNPNGISLEANDDTVVQLGVGPLGGTGVSVNTLLARFEGPNAGFPGGDLTGFHISSNGDFLMSYDDVSGGAYTIGDNTIATGSLIRFNALTGAASTVLDAGALGTRVDAVTQAANGDILFSTRTAGTIDAALSSTGASFAIDDGDILSLDSATGLISRIVSESEIFTAAGAEVAGMHLLDDNTLILTSNRDDTYIGLDGTVLEEAAILYDLTTRSATGIFFDGRDAFLGSHDLDAIFFSSSSITVPAPGASALLAAAVASLGQRRRR